MQRQLYRRGVDRRRLRRLARRRPDSAGRHQPAAAGGRRRDGGAQPRPSVSRLRRDHDAPDDAPSAATGASCRQFRHEGGRAGTYSVAYTLSRNRTDATNDRDAVDVPQNPLDFAAEYADARTDRRHIFNAHLHLRAAVLPRLDPNAFLRWTLGGWQISGITTVSSGAPVPRLLIGTNTGRRGNRANLVGDPRGGEFDYPVLVRPGRLRHSGRRAVRRFTAGAASAAGPQPDRSRAVEELLPVGPAGSSSAPT